MKVKIKELGDIITGNTPSKKILEFWNANDICFVKPDIIDDSGITSIEKSNEYLSEAARSKARVVKKDTIFVTCIGSIGKIGIAKEGEYAFNQQINAIVPSSKVCARYLAYALFYAKPQLIAIANAPVVPIINKSQFGDFEINIAENIKEQAEKVAVLDGIKGIIDARRQELQKLDELIKARFVEMFGDTKANDKAWKTMSLLETLEKGSSVSYGIVQTGDNVDGGIPVFRPIDIAGGHIPSREELKCTTKEISDKHKRTLLKGYELLITVRGSIGETFQVTEEFLNCNVGRNIVPLRFDTNKVLYKYMEHYFAQSGTKDILASMTKGIALQGLNMSEFRDIQVIVPPMERQREFSSFSELVDKSKVAVQKALDETQLLFDSLMQEYFG